MTGNMMVSAEELAAVDWIKATAAFSSKWKVMSPLASRPEEGAFISQVR
jgi:hypothetical protein